jgi:hypothetical protein
MRAGAPNMRFGLDTREVYRVSRQKLLRQRGQFVHPGLFRFALDDTTQLALDLGRQRRPLVACSAQKAACQAAVIILLFFAFIISSVKYQFAKKPS